MSLAELAAAVPVDVMPGAGDPANYTLPQQPLHRCLLPGAAAYSSLHRAPNPHDFSVDGMAFLGTSGQNVDDVARCVPASRSAGGPGGRRRCFSWARRRGPLPQQATDVGVHHWSFRPALLLPWLSLHRKLSPCPGPPRLPPSPTHTHLHTHTHPHTTHTPRYSDFEDRAGILGALLRWRHLAPTAPDTLAAYPYFDSDPFILDACPHVLFAGGQPAFETALVEGGGGPGEEGGRRAVRVVAVPNFCSTGCMVLVNLATLACHPVYFDAELQG